MTPHASKLCSSQSVDGIFAPYLFQGSNNDLRFESYVEEYLLPHLNPFRVRDLS